MTYIITNGTVYLATSPDNHCVTTSHPERATMFNKRSKAENRLRCIPNTLKNLHFEIKCINHKEAPAPPPEEPHQQAIVPTVHGAPPDSAVYSLLMAAQNFGIAVNDVVLSSEQYNKELSKIDREIEDIEHKAEFDTLSASEGYKLYKMLHEARRRRRVYKDGISILGIIKNTTSDELVNGTFTSRIIGLSNRTYSPRELPELFGSS